MVALDEFEQEEQIKQWIKQNVPWIIGGVVVGLAGIFGYRYWESAQLEKTAMASNIYDQMLIAHRQDDATALQQDFSTLQSNYPGGSYALFGALLLAKTQAEDGEYDQALATLRGVLPIAEKANFADLVRSRIARLALVNGQPDQALAALNQNKTRAFQAISQELAGDAYLAKDDIQSAREAYMKALSASRQPTALLQQKYTHIEQIIASRGVAVNAGINSATQSSVVTGNSAESAVVSSAPTVADSETSSSAVIE